MRPRVPCWSTVVVVVLLAVGLGLRLYGYNFDDGQLLHPDELAIDQVVVNLGCCLGNPGQAAATWPGPLSHFFDAKLAPYDPRFFNYGSLPLYLLAFITRSAAFLGGVIPGLGSWKAATDLVHTSWIGRWLSALFDGGSLLVVYRLAREIFDRQIALVALFFATFSVLDIQLSHFYAVDTILTFFVLLSLLGAVRVAKGGRTGAYVLMGAAFGAALATKTSAFPLILPICAAPLFSLAGARAHGNDVSRGRRTGPVAGFALARLFGPRLNPTLLRLLLSLAVTVVTFAVFEPYGIIDNKLLVSDVSTQNGIIVSHTILVPYTMQFFGTTPYLYYLKNLVLWYLGPALGITACAGLIWFGWQLLRGGAAAGQALLLLWVIPYFLIVGRFWAKFGRYLLPVIPVLCCLAAAFLVMALRKLPTRWRPAGWSAIGLVCLCTAASALAYMHIYETPNSQIQASRWIYSHLRPGEPFATEGAWDRSLPFCLPQPGQCPSGYNSLQLNLYDSDTGAKVARLVYALTHDRYIVMSTQRFIDSIPKQAAQYPITTRYYQLLFHDRLNFRLVKRFAVHPQLGPWIIDDFPADENFTVFDHPDVRIFRRIGPITAARARDLLTRAQTSGLSLPEADAPPPRWAMLHTASPSRKQAASATIGGREEGHAAHATLPPVDISARHQDTRLMLNGDQWNENQRATTYDQMFPPHGFGMGHPILVWLAVVELLGLAIVPITYVVFRGLADRGWIVAKTVGFLFVAWAAWVAVSLGWLSYSFATIWGIIGVTVVIGAIAWWRMRIPMLAFLRRQGTEVLVAELVFLAGFLAFILLRMWYPDLGHQFSPVSPSNAGAGRMGEKQLELAFLNAITRSQTFPPLDPFFSGGFINYYYFGYVVVATLCKATTIAPATGFNLAIPTFFGLLAGTSYSIGRALTRSRLFGLVTVAFVGFIGNLNGLVQVVQDVQSVSQMHVGVPVVGGAVELASSAFQATVGHAPLPPFDFWASTRILPPVGVNFAEFPYFTYLFGDLHAHLMAMPMDLAIIALALSLVLSRPRSADSDGAAGDNPPRRGLARIKRVGPFAGPILMGGFILGSIEATNPVDFPVSLVILGMGFAMAIAVRTRRSVLPSRDAALERSHSEALDGARSWTAAFRLHEAHLIVAGGLTAITALLAVLLFPPLVQGYHPVFSTGLETVNSQAGVIRSALESGQPALHGAQLASAAHDALVTPLPVYWETFGLFLFIIGTWVIVGFGLKRRQPGTRVRPRGRRGRLILMSLTAIGTLTLVLFDLWLLGFLLAGAAAIIGMAGLSGRRRPSRVLFVAGITLVALALTVFAEMFFIPDYLSGSLAFRMNTIAKFSTQMWLLYAISAAACLRFLLALVHVRRTIPRPLRRGALTFSVRRPRPTARGDAPAPVRGRGRIVTSRRIWTAFLIIGVVGSAVYTFSGTVARETYRQTWLPEASVPFTLDGMAFMRRAYPNDYAAINWLNANVRGTPTILEADQAYYNWRSRVVQFTGLPTLYGGIYESAQRYGDEVAPRQSVLEEIYGATASNASSATLAQFHIAGCPTNTNRAAACVAEKLLHAYHVSYVYVGSMEQQLWPLGTRKFATMRGLSPVFHQGDASIYHVNGSPT